MDEGETPMPTMTIDLPPEVEQQLREEAASQGLDVAGYVTRLLVARRTAERRRLESVDAVRTRIVRAAQDREAQRARNRAGIAILDQWSTQDAARGDAAGPPPEIEPLRLRELDRD